jgi:hypothetical protein
MPTFHDRALADAFKEALGHPAPFADDECRHLVGPLRIQHAQDLSELRHCPNLRRLELFGCDITDLDFLVGLQQLTTLKVTASTLAEINRLADCPTIEHLELNFTFVEDMRPLLALPRLKSGTLLGNPWSEESFYQLRPQLLQEDSGQGPLLEFSTRQDWQFGRKLYDYGVPFTFSGLDGTRRVMVRPGIPVYTQAGCDFINDTEYPVEFLLFELQKMAEVGPEVTALVFDMLAKSERENANRNFDLNSHRTLGHALEARQWVEQSLLPPTEKAQLLRFIARFPKLIFYKEDKAVIAAIEAMTQATLPAWFADVRTALAFVLPGEQTWVNFDASATSRLSGDFQFELNQFVVSWDPRKRFVEGNERIQPFTIATSPDIQLLLVFNSADSDDKRIYTYNIESLKDPFYDQEHSLSDVLRVVFDSYADLFDHISGIAVSRGDKHILLEAGPTL